MELMAFKRMHDDGILNFEREKNFIFSLGRKQ